MAPNGMEFIFRNKHFRLIWDLMITAFTLHLAVYIPYHLALPSSKDNLFFSGTILLTLIFTFDIWLDYRYPYYQLDPMYKSSGRKRHRLLQNGLLFDILAALPLGLFSNSIIRLVRLAKLYKVRIILGRLRIQNLRFSQQFSLMYLVLVIFLVTHWISCGWLLIRTPDPNLGTTENYINALYWSLTTISTVGYGDI
nr:ion transporter [Saprospiraceae bacterium]